MNVVTLAVASTMARLWATSAWRSTMTTRPPMAWLGAWGFAGPAWCSAVAVTVVADPMLSMWEVADTLQLSAVRRRSLNDGTFQRAAGW
jgi:hypothetical protein